MSSDRNDTRSILVPVAATTLLSAGLGFAAGVFRQRQAANAAPPQQPAAPIDPLYSGQRSALTTALLLHERHRDQRRQARLARPARYRRHNWPAIIGWTIAAILAVLAAFALWRYVEVNQGWASALQQVMNLKKHLATAQEQIGSLKSQGTAQAHQLATLHQQVKAARQATAAAKAAGSCQVIAQYGPTSPIGGLKGTCPPGTSVTFYRDYRDFTVHMG